MKNSLQVAIRYVQWFGLGWGGDTVREVRNALVQRRECARKGHPLTVSTGYATPDTGCDGAHCQCGRAGFHVTYY